ncbi:MAG TPA: hypothetical protein PK445_03125 [Methanolinea sp.]|jgi:hypothetical protein|nr:hypothetical protein [Methanolinea sp.]HOL41904.1 hypothetical protein [Methanospirillum sp.]HOS81699.1 hypothetical protein [Methanolinea sp.]HRU80550.1 hypothetical protein [Methanolinea sp.]
MFHRERSGCISCNSGSLSDVVERGSTRIPEGELSDNRDGFAINNRRASVNIYQVSVYSEKDEKE